MPQWQGSPLDKATRPATRRSPPPSTKPRLSAAPNPSPKCRRWHRRPNRGDARANWMPWRPPRPAGRDRRHGRPREGAGGLVHSAGWAVGNCRTVPRHAYGPATCCATGSRQKLHQLMPFAGGAVRPSFSCYPFSALLAASALLRPGFDRHGCICRSRLREAMQVRLRPRKGMQLLKDNQDSLSCLFSY